MTQLGVRIAGNFLLFLFILKRNGNIEHCTSKSATKMPHSGIMQCRRCMQLQHGHVFYAFNFISFGWVGGGSKRLLFGLILGSIFGSIFTSILSSKVGSIIGSILGSILGYILGLIFGLNIGFDIGVKYWVQYLVQYWVSILLQYCL